MADLDWLATMDGENFLAIYDVCLDIEKELNIAFQPLRIPLFQMAVKFRSLCPVNTVGARDRYIEMRWKAANFLLTKGLVRSVEFVDGGHRWESAIEISVDEKSFRSLMISLNGEYERRRAPNVASKGADPAADALEILFDKFHAIAIQLRNRPHNRLGLLIEDEFDVQYLFGALLLLNFDDVRREEFGPSYAGKSTRVDFYLKDEKILIEIKKTRSGFTAKQIGEELTVDIAHYKRRHEAKYLICFVYDPDFLITNSVGFVNDLSSVDKDFEVEIVVRPKR